MSPRRDPAGPARDLIDRHVRYWVDVSRYPFWLRELHDDLDPWCGPGEVDRVVRRLMSDDRLRPLRDGQLYAPRPLLRRRPRRRAQG